MHSFWEMDREADGLGEGGRVKNDVPKEVSHMCNISAGVREEGGLIRLWSLLKPNE